MTVAVFHKLLAIFLTVSLGWVVGRMRWLGGAGGPTDAARGDRRPGAEGRGAAPPIGELRTIRS